MGSIIISKNFLLIGVLTLLSFCSSNNSHNKQVINYYKVDLKNLSNQTNQKSNTSYKVVADLTLPRR